MMIGQIFFALLSLLYVRMGKVHSGFCLSKHSYTHTDVGFAFLRFLLNVFLLLGICLFVCFAFISHISPKCVFIIVILMVVVFFGFHSLCVCVTYTNDYIVTFIYFFLIFHSHSFSYFKLFVFYMSLCVFLLVVHTHTQHKQVYINI